MSHWETRGKSDEWYTPAFIFEALGCQFDLDVAAPLFGLGAHVPADRFIADDSLECEWVGFIWMNPPFGGRNGLEPWLEKFFDHGNGIALTPDRTSTAWFQAAARRAELMLFMPKVKFQRPDGSIGTKPSNGTVLMAIGNRGVTALRRASHLGLLMSAFSHSKAPAVRPEGEPVA